MTGTDSLNLYLEGKADTVSEKECPKCRGILLRIDLTGDVTVNNIMCVNEECDYRLDLIEGGRTNEDL